MKKFVFIFASVGILVFSSCVQTNTQNDIAPQMAYSGNVTLNGTAIPSLDTLTVGDTLLLPLSLQGYYNILTSFKVSNDTTVSKVTFPGISAFGSLVLDNDTTNLKNGYIYLAPVATYSAGLEVQYVSTKPSKTATLGFTLSSTSSYSPATVSLSVPAKAK
jgi:spore germination protein YaaH